MATHMIAERTHRVSSKQQPHTQVSSKFEYNHLGMVQSSTFFQSTSKYCLGRSNDMWAENSQCVATSAHRQTNDVGDLMIQSCATQKSFLHKLVHVPTMLFQPFNVRGECDRSGQGPKHLNEVVDQLKRLFHRSVTACCSSAQATTQPPRSLGPSVAASGCLLVYAPLTPADQ